MFLETLGQEGLREMALQNVHKARYAACRPDRHGSPASSSASAAPSSTKFVLDLPKPAAAVAAALKAKGILGGLPLGRFVPGARNALLSR